MLSFTAMRTNRRKKARPSKDQVRAWLTTVIAPLASALALERDRVARGNWSFRCETQDFEYLWPIEKMVAVPYLPNLRQFLRHSDDVRKLAVEHDTVLGKLRIAARDAYEQLVRNERFQTLALAASVSNRDHRYFAEYIVNGLRDLASHYALHDLWTREAAKFLELRNDPALATKFSAIDAAGRKLSTAVNSLHDVVTTLQVDLADQYKLPPVDPSDAVRV